MANARAVGKNLSVRSHPRGFHVSDRGPTVTRPPTARAPDADGGIALDATTAADLQRLRDVSHLLDDSIRVPGTTYRIGVEPVVGLLPVVGDALGAAVAVYVLAIAARTGVPRATLARIAVVFWIDAAVGAVPVAGDVFDAYWKANLRAVRLLDTRLADPASAAADRRYLWRLGVAAGFLGLIAAAAVGSLAWWLLGRV